MTSLIEPIPVFDDINHIKRNIGYVKNHNHKCKHVLKSKENTLRHKCNKSLKRKLKQYRLRPDGKEDQDILDVSNILINSLTIKSPGSKDSQLENHTFVRPRNYLFRMVRNSKISSGNSINASIGNENEINSDCDQEKKQTNAFKLLMDSRNKSIGGNSPGKDKMDEENPDQDFLEKKNIKAKRILVLQQMSEAKGALKKREIEENQDKYIEVAMKKRAEKFKNMLLTQVPKSHDIKQKTTGKQKKSTVSKIQNNIDTKKSKSESDSKQRSLQLVSLFNDIEEDYDKNTAKNNKETLTKEDKEFLEKLSPSMKKKGNMLCYFMKVEKETEPSVTEDDVVIKVKLPSKVNKKSKNRKKTIVTNGELCSENVSLNITNSSSDLSTRPVARHKRKRNFALPSQEVKIDEIDILEDTSNRPKRNIKKPVKYNDDILLSSSDEELYIFTPKKKKHTDNETVPQIKTPILGKTSINSKETSKIRHKTEKTPVQVKKNVKLAPIFNTKQRPDPVASEAKQKFLQSGVPEQLKKIISQQKSSITGEDIFYTVVHVQQPMSNKNINYSTINIPMVNVVVDDVNYENQHHNYLFQQFLDLDPKMEENLYGSQSHVDVIKTLRSVKQDRPKFPVYRTYRLLRDKKKGEFKGPNYLDLDNSVEVNNSTLDTIIENPDQLNWTDKYKTMSTNQIFGNCETVQELKKWLVLWTETEQKSKSNAKANSDSSDFCYSDTDSRDSVRNVNNLLIITGPTGSGKTSSVYAVAADLAIKVIEVNASSKRTGKIMLQDLQEATQSHKVNRGAGSTENVPKSQEITQVETIPKSKKRGRPKKNILKLAKKSEKEPKQDTVNAISGSQDVTRTHTSLILIDDADIMFDQDDGFCSAIAQLVHCSKRPVILVTSSLSCLHLQRFIQNSKILKMNPLPPRILGTWLDIMCLADSGSCSIGAGAKFLNYFNGDIRKAINCLQFYASSQPQCSVTDNVPSQVYDDTNKLNIDDEQSSMFWADEEDNEEKTIAKIKMVNKEKDYLWDNYVKSQFSSSHKFPLETFNIWWSLPQELSLEEDKANSARLESIATVMDCMSISDGYSIRTSDKLNITSDPWISAEAHSVSEFEDMNIYKRSAELSDEISNELINISILNAQTCFKKRRALNFDSPGMTMQRERDRIVARHNNISSFLNPSAVLDRRALALDYWTSCRAICRIEKTKSDNSSKRNNRFCHYLRSLSILCKNESFDYLCDSLSLAKNKEDGHS